MSREENNISFRNKIFGSFKKDNYPLHIGLFVLTFLTCMIAGTQWAFKDFTEISNWHYGITYAALILGFLTAHEFGHYIASRIHGVNATLPYYIPFPLPFFINFGTFGAVIKTRTPIPSRKAMFDIGAAGPIAGFIVCIIYLVYGLMTLPTIDYIYQLHPNYITEFAGRIPDKSLHFGDTILFTLMAKVFANPHGFLPPMNEIYHYPFLNVGWFGLFVTTLNMLPIGQLDGGHITFSMFGEKIHRIIAKSAWWLMIVLGIGALLGLLHELLKEDYPGRIFIFIQDTLLPPLEWINDHFPYVFKFWFGWLFWAVITKFVIKINHPPVLDETPIGTKRMLIGWITLIILLLSFSYNGIYVIE